MVGLLVNECEDEDVGARTSSFYTDSCACANETSIGTDNFRNRQETKIPTILAELPEFTLLP